MKRVDTAYGKFEDVYYDELTNAKDEEIGCEIISGSTPGDTVDATRHWLDPRSSSRQGRKNNRR